MLENAGRFWSPCGDGQRYHGIALRLGPTRSVQGDVAEIAVGARFGQGFQGSRWAIAVRKGVAF